VRTLHKEDCGCAHTVLVCGHRLWNSQQVHQQQKPLHLLKGVEFYGLKVRNLKTGLPKGLRHDCSSTSEDQTTVIVQPIALWLL